MSGAISGERQANVVALEFWADTETDREGKQRVVHWVRWAKRGDLHYSQVEDKVDRLSKVRDEQGQEIYDPVWLSIRAAYEAWSKGQDVPVDGTPLESWAGVSKKDAKALKQAGFAAVEDFAAATDTDLGRIKVPYVRRLRDAARTYVESKDGTQAVTAALAERDQEINALKAQMDELAALNREITAALKRQMENVDGNTP